MMSNEKQLEILNSLGPEEREYAIKILKEFADTGKSESLDFLKYGDFEEVPVDIDTFLDNDTYLGKGLWEVDALSGERKCTVWPFWRETLKELFPDNLTTAYNTLILTGAIGIGKSMCGVLAMLYLLYRMLCLKDPYAYFGMQPIDKITFSMLNITLDAAQGVAWDKAQQLIQSSDWFKAHGDVNASRSNPQWQPEKHIELIFGSQNRHVVGRALFANLTDEVNFGIGSDVEKKKEKQKKLIAQIDARMRSRFLRGTYLPTLNIIISSKDSEQAFLNTYIETKRKNESKSSLIIDQPQWVVDPRKGSPDDPGAFWVAIGNKFLAHELLPLNADDEMVAAYEAKGYTMKKVPPGYREVFEDNLDQALMDILGWSSSAGTKYISGARLNQAKVDYYSNPFTKDVITVGNAPDDFIQYSNFFDLNRVSPLDMDKPLFIHLDLSKKKDKTGIAGTWILGRREGAGETARDLEYKLAFSVSVEAPKGWEVSFAKTRQFIRWLRDVGFRIKGISADTFQSVNILQDLQADGFKITSLSVDRLSRVDGLVVDEATGATSHVSYICLPYDFLKTSIYERRVKIYQKCDLLTNELVGLEKKADGHIDHTPDGINSKDQADAFCGSLYLASQFAEEYAYSINDIIDSTTTINSEMSDKERKTQMIVDFEDALKSAYMEVDRDLKQREREVNQQKEEEEAEYQFYQDILDGIIAI